MPKREVEYRIDEPAHIGNALAWARAMVQRGLESGPVRMVLTRPRRSSDQNAKLWPMLRDISRQVVWYGERLTEEEWKDVLTAGIRRQKAVPGIEGGFVVLGAHTSGMSRELFSELIEFAYWFGGDKGVEWSEPARTAWDEYIAARGLEGAAASKATTGEGVA